MRDIANALNALYDVKINKKRLFVFRSTMVPGTMRNVVVDYLERNCSLRRGKDYDVFYNPEFVRQHSALEDFFTPDRVVIGQEKIGSSYLSDLYTPLTDKIILTGFEEAEMIKYASNCFLALKISYFNEISMICKKMGISEDRVAQAVSMDNRIGRYGTNGGLPFGGACLPKDTEAFASFARNMNVKDDLIETAIRINKQMDEFEFSKGLCKADSYERTLRRGIRFLTREGFQLQKYHSGLVNHLAEQSPYRDKRSCFTRRLNRSAETRWPIHLGGGRCNSIYLSLNLSHACKNIQISIRSNFDVSNNS